ncbi:respiratory burst oxidase homolog protein B-like isoform X2 [Gastrolobium bilobum]|nr:respiratory burst oxidase homolog protein B-like isoform X2 [Gastrolobium bilobum]XP_061351528.1 respiratory burst oxidase homolog protein B-like isoform X2 [Gastrolobium bilobum]
MLSSSKFANELLRALRGNEDWKFNITKTELHTFWFRMKDDSINSRMRIFFDMCNRNMDGRITEMDIKQLKQPQRNTNLMLHEGFGCAMALLEQSPCSSGKRNHIMGIMGNDLWYHFHEQGQKQEKGLTRCGKSCRLR